MQALTARPPNRGAVVRRPPTAVVSAADPALADDWAYRPITGHPRLSKGLTVAAVVVVAAMFIAGFLMGFGVLPASRLPLMVATVVACLLGVAAYLARPVPTAAQRAVAAWDIQIEGLRLQLDDAGALSLTDQARLDSLVALRDRLIAARPKVVAACGRQLTLTGAATS